MDEKLNLATPMTVLIFRAKAVEQVSAPFLFIPAYFILWRGRGLREMGMERLL